MQGTIGGSLRPCTSLLHSSLSLSAPPSRLSLYRSLVVSIPPSINSKVSVTFGLKSSRSIECNDEKMLRSNVVHRLCGHRGGGGGWGLGLPRHLTKVAAKRSLLSELQTLKQGAEGGRFLSVFSFTQVRHSLVQVLSAFNACHRNEVLKWCNDCPAVSNMDF